MKSGGAGQETISNTPVIDIKKIEFIKKRLGNHVTGLQLVELRNKYIMTGKSKSYYYKQLAQQAALEIIPDKGVQNDIEVVG